jgi:hypothetical protein
MAKPVLHLVRRYRPSVIVDMSHDPPGRMTPPFSFADHDAMRTAAVPAAVTRAMWVAAWARAEHCPLNIVPAGWLEPHCKYEPSDDLWAATSQTMRELVGCLGFAVPIMLDQHKRAWAASWPWRWEVS